jgi:hypothetical protein
MRGPAHSKKSVALDVLDIFDNTLHKRAGVGYAQTTFVLSMVVRAVRCLVYSGQICDITLFLHAVRLLLELLEIFSTSSEKLGNEPNISGALECVDLSVELLHHIFILGKEGTEKQNGADNEAYRQRSSDENKIPSQPHTDENKIPSATPLSMADDRSSSTPPHFMFTDDNLRTTMESFLPSLQRVAFTLRGSPRAKLITNKKTLRFLRNIIAGRVVPLGTAKREASILELRSQLQITLHNSTKSGTKSSASGTSSVSTNQPTILLPCGSHSPATTSSASTPCYSASSPSFYLSPRGGVEDVYTPRRANKGCGSNTTATNVAGKERDALSFLFHQDRNTRVVVSRPASAAAVAVAAATKAAENASAPPPPTSTGTASVDSTAAVEQLFVSSLRQLGYEVIDGGEKTVSASALCFGCNWLRIYSPFAIMDML